jgi:hypothetical protein
MTLTEIAAELRNSLCWCYDNNDQHFDYLPADDARRLADALDAAAKELQAPDMAYWPEEAVWTVRFLRGEVERLRADIAALEAALVDARRRIPDTK